MRDFPVFATQCGVGSLAMREIPYTGSAYITVRDASDPERFLQECVEFCKVAGAEKVYATGAQWLDKFPQFSLILEMRLSNTTLPDTCADVRYATKSTVETWRQLYNEKMQCVANVSYMSIREAEQAVAQGRCVYVYRENVCIGIGMLTHGRIDALASCVSGMGKDVLAALCNAVGTADVTLQVEKSNHRAVKLYIDFGFRFTGEETIWYKIL